MKYLVRNPLAYACIFATDLFLSPLLLRKKKIIPQPRSILLSNTAQLGDLVLATALLPLLKEAFPDIKIGFLAGGWGKEMLEKHPLIDRFHRLDHWKQTRASKPLKHKLQEYWRQRKQVLKELKEERYDVACELNFYFPSMSPLFFQTQIPCRIGYTSAGLSPLLTHPFKWEDKPQSAARYFLDLLTPLFPTHHLPLKSSLAAISSTLVLQQPYCLLHMGSGNPAKEWPLSKWRELATQLAHQGEYLVFTGKGEKEKRDIETVIRDLPNTLNLCDQLDWNSYVSIIQKAALLIGVDTSAAHVAAAFDTPSVLIYSGINSLAHWRPLNEKAVILHAASIRDIVVQDVLEKVNSYFGK